MPIITVQFIKDVVATPEQKHELIVRLTDTFVDILGDVVRPFVYTIIQETPQAEWGIAGVPMPDLVYLTSEKHAAVIEKSNAIMRSVVEQAQSASRQTDAFADQIWRGEVLPDGTATTSAADADRRYWERWFDELWNKKNYDIVYEYVDDNFTAHGAGGQQIKMGPNGPKDMVKAWHAAMPDGKMTIDDIITEGDLSTIRMTWRATHTGKFGEIPPSGNKIEVTSIGIDRVVNGKITEGWGELNMLGMMQQMGAIPSPQQQQAQSAAPAAANVAADGDQLARNKAVVHQYHEATNNKNFGQFYQLVRADFVNHLGPIVGDQVGVSPLLATIKSFSAGFPDLKVTEEYVVAQGDRVAARIRMSGTNTGAFMGMPPSGKPASWTGLIIYRVHEDGRIIERWQDFDMVNIMQQIGAIPS